MTMTANNFEANINPVNSRTIMLSGSKHRVADAIKSISILAKDMGISTVSLNVFDDGQKASIILNKNGNKLLNTWLGYE